MNIWYIHPFAGGPGVGRLFRPYHLGKEWARLGHDATVITADHHHHLDPGVHLAPEQMVNGVRYVAVPVRQYSGNGIGRILNMVDFARGVGKLGKRVGQDMSRPDAVVASSPHPFYVLHAWRIARRHGARFVIEVRDLWPLSLQEMLGLSSWHPFVLACGWIERFAYRRADVVVSLLAGVDRYIERIGLHPKAFLWAPNGVDPDDIDGAAPVTPAGSQAAQQIAAWQAEGRAVVIYAGAIGPPNGLETLVDAVHAANQSGDAASFGVVIVGQGTLSTVIADRARELGLDNLVMFPPVPKAEAIWLIRRSDIGYGGLKAHDEVFQYGTSQNKIMDYLLAGLPVLFPVQAYKDPVTEAGAGIAIHAPSPDSVGKALLTLAGLPPSDRKAMGARGNDYVRSKFDWRTIAKDYADALAASSIDKLSS